MKLDEIKKIVQTSESDEVNKYLSEGYRIVKIISAKVSTSGGDFISPCYILGYAGGD